MHDIFAVFHLSGNIPVSKEQFITHDRFCEMCPAAILRTLAGMLSCLVALFGFRFASILNISSSVVGRKWSTEFDVGLCKVGVDMVSYWGFEARRADVLFLVESKSFAIDVKYCTICTMLYCFHSNNCSSFWQCNVTSSVSLELRGWWHIHESTIPFHWCMLLTNGSHGTNKPFVYIKRLLYLFWWVKSKKQATLVAPYSRSTSLSFRDFIFQHETRGIEEFSHSLQLVCRKTSLNISKSIKRYPVTSGWSCLALSERFRLILSEEAESVPLVLDCPPVFAGQHWKF